MLKELLSDYSRKELLNDCVAVFVGFPIIAAAVIFIAEVLK